MVRVALMSELTWKSGVESIWKPSAPDWSASWEAFGSSMARRALNGTELRS